MSQFLAAQATTMPACDLFTIDTMFLKRIRVLSFIEHGTRRVHLARHTANPTGAWVTQQARNLHMEMGEQADRIKVLVHDRDTKVTAACHQVFTSGTVRRECTDRLLICGGRYLSGVLSEHVGTTTGIGRIDRCNKDHPIQRHQ